MSSPRPDGRITLLDCTLRDGGYYNDWDFSPALIRRYVKAMRQAGVEAVELGFRTLERDRYLGPTAYSTDRFLESLELPPSQTVGVMLNAKELVAADDPAAAVDLLFQAAADSPVDLVRIATNFAELEPLRPAIDRLKDLGYRVGVNLMQVAARSVEEIDEFGSYSSRSDVDLAYVADSFGALQPTDVTDIVAALKGAFAGPVGCHMHDNMGLAFANTLAAIAAGAEFVDSTILGMGRGPGNARTEFLAIELARRGSSDIDVLPLLPLATHDFAALQAEYGWGSSAYYFLSAANGIHPTYVQEMTADGRYSVDEIVSAVHRLGTTSGSSFTREELHAAVNRADVTTMGGTWDATGWCSGRDVLIVGPGPRGIERRADVEEFIRRDGPLVMALNALPPVDPNLVDAYAICHPVRAEIDADTIKGIRQPLFMPGPIAERVGQFSEGAELRDYGLAVMADHFAVGPSSCTVPVLSSFPYALALACAGGASRVLLAGFDGFAPGDARQAEMETIFSRFAEIENGVPVVAVTRTSYPIAQTSIYAT